MKKTILLTAFILMLSGFLSAQSVLFHENFEAPSFGNSLLTTADSLVGGVFTVPCLSFKPWAISTKLFNSGMRCDTSTLQPNKTIYLTSLPFSTVGINNVYLQFSHICKLHFADGGYVEVSNDNGITWHTLGVNQYLDSTGIMIQNKFCENSYGTQWGPGDTIIKPTNSWWRTEHFDISSLTLNSPNVKIRFKYYTTGMAVSSGRYGWLIDDVKVYQTFASQYTVTATASCNICGTTTGSGIFLPNQIDTVKAIVNPGFGFFNWTENGISVSVNPIYAFNVNYNKHLYANFYPIVTNCLTQFMVVPDTTIPHHYYVYTYVSGNPPFHYLWNWGDGTIDTIINPSHTFNNSGFYNICLKVTDASGCISTYCDSSYLQKSTNTIITMQVIPRETTGVFVNAFPNQIKIYPNPTSNNLTIETNSNFKQNIEITNLLGQTMYTYNIYSKATIDVSRFPKGIYILKLNTDKGIVVKKFVKE